MAKSYQPRKYQTEAIDIVFKKLSTKVKSQLIVMATGLGKTFIATQISTKFGEDIKKSSRVLFVAHREELIEQSREAFDDFYPMQSGIVKGPLFEIDKKIVVASVQTITNRLDRIKDKYFDLIFIDEAHHYMAETYLRVAEHFNPKLKIGLTATPERLDGLSLGNIFEEIVYQYNIDQGIKDKFLCELQGIRVATDVDISKVKRTGGDFVKSQLSKVINIPERNYLVVRKYLHFAKDRQGIFFCVDMQHAMDLADAFNELGVKAEFVTSDKDKCPDRKERIARFKKGETTVLTNVMILTEGFDHPDTGVIGMIRPTQSKTVYIQCIGRGTRLKGKKFLDRFNSNNCVILDFVDNCGKHKLVNTFTLDQGKRIEERTFETSKRKDTLIEMREQRQRKLEKMYKKDKMVDLLELPEIYVYAQKGKMKEPATEKQISWIKNLGLWQEGVVYTKGHASELITHSPAQDWQIHKLAQWGYDIRKGATQGQYYEINRERKQKSSEPVTPLPKF